MDRKSDKLMVSRVVSSLANICGSALTKSKKVTLTIRNKLLLVSQVETGLKMSSITLTFTNWLKTRCSLGLSSFLNTHWIQSSSQSVNNSTKIFWRLSHTLLAVSFGLMWIQVSGWLNRWGYAACESFMTLTRRYVKHVMTQTKVHLAFNR